jgi:glycerate 2-kinase
MRRSVKLRGETLFVKRLKVNLQRFERIFVLGGGKATGAMATELEAMLGNRITAGAVNVPDYLPAPRLRQINPHRSTHPFPSELGEEGVKAMLDLAGRATSRDLYLCLFSGGGSALMPLPAQGLSLEDKLDTTGILLRCGADIEEMNVVRRHLSDFKGGRLAERLRGATVVSLVISDVPGDKFETVSSGPTAPDASTFAQARAILEKYQVWRKVPGRVRRRISRGEAGQVPDTPKPGSPIFTKVRNVLIGSNRDARLAAFAFLRRSGVSAVLRDGFYQGESSKVGERLAKELNRLEPRASSRPYGMVAGGEATVTVKGGGVGGRDQELVLSAARFLKMRVSTFSALATDGVDGPSGAAGAIADSDTVRRGNTCGLSIQRALDDNDSNTYFRKLGDLLVCPQTGTNVNDVVVALAIRARPRPRNTS